MQPENFHDLFILLLIAVITGFVLPALVKSFEIVFTKRVEKQVELRAMQLEILEQLTKVVWEWRFLGKQVCYYGCDYKNKDERFRAAARTYNDKVWKLFTEIKAIKSRSIVWYPKVVPEEIEKLYDYIKRNVDAPMTELMERSSDGKPDVTNHFFQMQADFSNVVSPRIEATIQKIAETIAKAVK